MMYTREELNEMANRINEAHDWLEAEDDINELMEAAEMTEEWENADGESFESLIYKAAEKLNIEID